MVLSKTVTCEKIRAKKVQEDVPENMFQCFRTKFLSLLCMISLVYKISRCLSANHNPELRCVICTVTCYTLCTSVTLFALVLQLNCTALSQSEPSNFFMCIIIN